MTDYNKLWSELSEAAAAINKATDSMNAALADLQLSTAAIADYEIWIPEFIQADNAPLKYQVGFKLGKFWIRSEDGKHEKPFLDCRRDVRIALAPSMCRLANLIQALRGVVKP